MNLIFCILVATDMAMAQSLHLYLLSTLLFALSATGASASHGHGLKSLHFVLYQHETTNKTGYVIVTGVEKPGLSQAALPFGTLYALQDPITVTSNSSSKVVGTTEGATVTSSIDGLDNIAVYKITLQLKHHKGSITVVGSINSVKPSEIPVVGGTGDFMFVQGYVTTLLVDTDGLAVAYKIEFHLYWPPYADQFLVHN